MKIIRSAAAFKRYYPYKSPPNPAPCPAPSEYPKRYPCVVWIEHCGGGLGGDYMEVHIVYPPKGHDIKAFMAGMRAREE